MLVMFFLVMLFGQVQQIEVRNAWDIALQFGMAGAVLVVVWFFLLYLKARDSQHERRDMAIAESSKALAKEIHELGVAIARLDASERRVWPRRERLGEEESDG